MKKNRLSIIVTLLSFSVFLVSCLEDLENTDKIANSTFKPAIEFPLINSDFNLQEFLTEGNSKAKIFEEDGVIVVSYEDSVTTPSADAIFNLPDQQSPILSVTGPEISFPSPGGSVAFSKTLTFDFNTSQGEILDSILFKGGQMALQIVSSFPANVDVTVSVSSLKIEGNNHKQNFNLNGTDTQNAIVSLEGTTLDLTDNGSTTNTLSFTISGTITDSGQPIEDSHSLECSFTLDDLQFRGLFGDMGTHPIPFSADSIDVDVFDNAFAGSIQLSSPSITLKLKNSFGLPIGFDIQEISALKDNHTFTLSGAALNAPQNPYRLDAPPSTNEAGQSVTTQIALTPDNSNLPELISSLPNYLSYLFGLTLNPAPATSKNFVLDDSNLTIGVHIEMPFHGSMSGLTISKQFDFDGLGIDDVDESFIKLSTVNEFPLSAAIQVYFVDISGTVLDSLFANPSIVQAASVDGNGFSQTPGERVMNVPVTQDKVNRIEQAEILVLTTVLNTSNNGTTPVKFSASNKLKINLGVNTRIKYELN